METERFKAFTYDELIKRDKVSLDIFWLKDESLEDAENLPAPEIIVQEIADNLESALDSVKELILNLEKKGSQIQLFLFGNGPLTVRTFIIIENFPARTFMP